MKTIDIEALQQVTGGTAQRIADIGDSPIQSPPVGGPTIGNPIRNPPVSGPTIDIPPINPTKIWPPMS